MKNLIKSLIIVALVVFGTTINTYAQDSDGAVTKKAMEKKQKVEKKMTTTDADKEAKMKIEKEMYT